MEDDGWFFDTELLVLAERAHLRIYEVPVDWIDDPDSRVDIIDTALADLRGIRRLRRTLPDLQPALTSIGGRTPAAAGRGDRQPRTEARRARPDLHHLPKGPSAMTATVLAPTPGTEPEVAGDAPPRDRRRIRRLLDGHPGDPRWARPSLLVLLASTAVLYL